MKILVICQYYAPEPFRISDICEELVKRGHEVQVVTGIPNYPMGKIYEEYKGGKRRDEVLNGVNVHRCFTIGRRTGAVYRFLNYYSYMISSSMYIKKLGDEYDIVFVNQLSPVIMANAGIKYKKKYNKKLVLYCLDLWPASLTAGGIKKESFIYKYFRKVSDKIYRQADKLLVTSKSFKTYFKEEFDINEADIKYLPQYAEEVFSEEACRKKTDENLNLMFAGNIGIAQSVDTIIKAANETRNMKNLYWHIVGDGTELENCKELVHKLGLSNVIFHGRHSMEEMPKYYVIADVMIVTMKADNTLSMTLPGKVQTYMAAGKPIIGAINGEAKAIIDESHCGKCTDAEDYVGLASLAYEFFDKTKNEYFGKNGRRYYDAAFTKRVFIDKLEDVFVMTCKMRGDI